MVRIMMKCTSFCNHLILLVLFLVCISNATLKDESSGSGEDGKNQPYSSTTGEGLNPSTTDTDSELSEEEEEGHVHSGEDESHFHSGSGEHDGSEPHRLTKAKTSGSYSSAFGKDSESPTSDKVSESSAPDTVSKSSTTDDDSSITDKVSMSSTTDKASKSSTTDESSDSSTTDESSDSSTTDESSDSSTTDESSDSSTDESSDSSTADESSDSSTADESSDSSTTDESSDSSTDESSDSSTSDESSDSSTTDESSDSSTDESSDSSTSDESSDSSTSDESSDSSTSDENSESSTTDKASKFSTTDERSGSGQEEGHVHSGSGDAENHFHSGSGEHDGSKAYPLEDTKIPGTREQTPIPTEKSTPSGDDSISRTVEPHSVAVEGATDFPTSERPTQTDKNVTEKLRTLIEEEGTEIPVELTRGLPQNPKDKVKFTTVIPKTVKDETLIKEAIPTVSSTEKLNTVAVSQTTAVTTKKLKKVSREEPPTSFLNFLKEIGPLTTVYPKVTTSVSMSDDRETQVKETRPTLAPTAQLETINDSTKTTTEGSEKVPTSFRSFLIKIRKDLDELLAWRKDHERKLHKVAWNIARVFKQETTDDGETEETPPRKHKREKRSKIDVQAKGLRKEIQSKINGYFPCRDPETMVPIKSGSSFFNQDQCLQCHCTMGRLNCVKDFKKCYPNGCHLMNGEMLPNLAIHNDGCNNCLCSFGSLICTHLRCAEAGHHYTNYKLNGMVNADPENLATARQSSEMANRAPDMCLECDHLPGPYVCGIKQWKTFPSLCHALFCGNNQNEDIHGESCEHLDPCTLVTCKENEKCVTYYQTPCLAGEKTTTMCQQYKCIAKKIECSNADGMVCGADGKTYSSECELFSKGTQLAYQGRCRKKCNSEVCGIESRTIPTKCHADDTLSYIDYAGPCEYHFTSRPLIIENFNGESYYHDQRCDMVYENARCKPTKCKTVIVPPGACCPVCGAALVVSLNLNQSSVIPLRLSEVQKFLLNLQHEVSQRLCKISIDLTYSMDILIVIQPYKTNRLNACNDMADEIVDKINFEREATDKGTLAFLGSATMVTGQSLETMDDNPEI